MEKFINIKINGESRQVATVEKEGTHFVACTFHDMNLLFPNGEQVNVPASGIVPRCQEKREVIGEIAGMPLVKKTLGKVTDLPDAQPGVVYLVSLAVAKATAIEDVLAVGSSSRGNNGQVNGATSLAPASMVD